MKMWSALIHTWVRYGCGWKIPTEEESVRMKDISSYKIEVQGMLEENDLNATCPIQVSTVNVDRTATRLAVCTDQSGLIGLIRHLHARGLVLISVYSERSAINFSRSAHSPQYNNQSA